MAKVITISKKFYELLDETNTELLECEMTNNEEMIIMRMISKWKKVWKDIFERVYLLLFLSKYWYIYTLWIEFELK